MLAISSFIALKDAVYNANKEKNSEKLIAPATAENILKSVQFKGKHNAVTTSEQPQNNLQKVQKNDFFRSKNVKSGQSIS